MDMLTIGGEKNVQNGSDQDASLIVYLWMLCITLESCVVYIKRVTVLIFFNPGLVCNRPIVNQHICVGTCCNRIFFK